MISSQDGTLERRFGFAGSAGGLSSARVGSTSTSPSTGGGGTASNRAAACRADASGRSTASRSSAVTSPERIIRARSSRARSRRVRGSQAQAAVRPSPRTALTRQPPSSPSHESHVEDVSSDRSAAAARSSRRTPSIGVARARSACHRRSSSTGPSNRAISSTATPEAAAISAAVSPQRIRCCTSRGLTCASSGMRIWPSPVTALLRRASAGTRRCSPSSSTTSASPSAVIPTN